ncbi:hypothetical protein I553_0896 [Mycobacterium xenopi 4042]|uniref:Uncharacterized protein n=1 Tax=Mycobacterium xenopi 4042 TaxID=1299334 RepID=X7YHM9_MYCXE|nr:hypothetical protein I553_0896 [Mycobacterium xenopi 4042]
MDGDVHRRRDTDTDRLRRRHFGRRETLSRFCVSWQRCTTTVAASRCRCRQDVVRLGQGRDSGTDPRAAARPGGFRRTTTVASTRSRPSKRLSQKGAARRAARPPRPGEEMPVRIPGWARWRAVVVAADSGDAGAG